MCMVGLSHPRSGHIRGAGNSRRTIVRPGHPAAAAEIVGLEIPSVSRSPGGSEIVHVAAVVEMFRTF
jgi:hypothetical protein